MGETSVRLRFVWGVQRLADKSIERIAKALGCYEAHAQSRRDAYLGGGSIVGNNGAERQVDDAAVRAVLREKINELRRYAKVNNVDFTVACNLDALSGTNNHLCGWNLNLINHQPLHCSKNYDLDSVNARAGGVQSFGGRGDA